MNSHYVLKEIIVFKFLTSSVGKKYVMGLCGLVWLGFVLSHMAGNLLLFVGADAYNQYSHALTSNKLIYVAEGGLVVALLVHVILAINLTLENRAARGTRYAVAPGRGPKGSTLASRTMAIQGSLILAFVILHLATFKFGTYYTTTVNGVEMRDIHRLVVEVFASPGYVIWYVIALGFLALHLSHGTRSVFQSFGLLHPSYQGPIKKLGVIYATLVVAGFLAQPIYIYTLTK